MIAAANVNAVLAEAQLYIAKTEPKYMDSKGKGRKSIPFQNHLRFFRKLENAG